MKSNSIILSLLVSLTTIGQLDAGDSRVKFEVRFRSAENQASGKAKFEAREDRLKFSVEVEDVSGAAEIVVSVRGSAFTLVLDARGSGDLDLDSRRGEDVPEVEVGDQITILAGIDVLLRAIFKLNGDANADGGMDISDAITILTALFLNHTQPIDWEAADSNSDGNVDIADALWVLNLMFRGVSARPEDTEDECEIRNRFVADVDGDGMREDGHVRARSRADRDDIEVEVGPLDVDSVTILISDDSDSDNAYFSAVTPVLINGDAELELEDGLPQSLSHMAGDSVFIQIDDDAPVFLSTVPALPDDCNLGDDPADEIDVDEPRDRDVVRGECWKRNRFHTDVDSDGIREDGHVRARSRADRDDVEVEVGPLDVDSVTILISDDSDPHNAYFSAPAPVREDGDAELELQNGLPQSLSDMAGDSVFVQVGDGDPVFLATVPILPEESVRGWDVDCDFDDVVDDDPDDDPDDDGDAGAPSDRDLVKGECWKRNRFHTDVDGDGIREDGHVRARSRPDRDDIEVEVGALDVDSVTILISDDSDPHNAYFSAVVQVLENGDAELELQSGLPQSLSHMAGDSVFVQVGDSDPVFLTTVPALPEESVRGWDVDCEFVVDDGDNDNDNDNNRECKQRERFSKDVDGDGVGEDGHVRARSRPGQDELEIEIGPLEVPTVTFLFSDDSDSHNAYFSAIVPVLENGEAELELRNGLPQSLSDMAGDSVFVQVGDGTPIFLATIPDCGG